MRKGKHLSSSARLSFLVVLFLCLAVFGFMAQSGIEKQGDLSQLRASVIADLNVGDLPVRNQTNGFSIIGIEKTPEGNVKTTLRNDYSKTIVAYQFSLGSKTTLVDSFTNAIKAGIEPGEVIEELQAIDVDPVLMRRGIVVGAVVFNDGASDGDARLIREIDEFRLGEMFQTEQFLSSLSNIRDASGPEAVSRFEEAKASMLTLENDKRFSRDFMSGLRNMRLVFSRDIDGIRNAPPLDRTKVMKAIMDHYQIKFREIRDYHDKAKQSRIPQPR